LIHHQGKKDTTIAMATLKRCLILLGIILALHAAVAPAASITRSKRHLKKEVIESGRESKTWQIEESENAEPMLSKPKQGGGTSSPAAHRGSNSKELPILHQGSGVINTLANYI